MKRLFYLMMFWPAIVYGQTIMHVNRLSGSTSDFNISNISKLTFTKTNMEIHGEGSSIPLTDLRKLTFSVAPSSPQPNGCPLMEASKLTLSFNRQFFILAGSGKGAITLKVEGFNLMGRRIFKMDRVMPSGGFFQLKADIGNFRSPFILRATVNGTNLLTKKIVSIYKKETSL